MPLIYRAISGKRDVKVYPDIALPPPLAFANVKRTIFAPTAKSAWTMKALETKPSLRRAVRVTNVRNMHEVAIIAQKMNNATIVDPGDGHPSADEGKSVIFEWEAGTDLAMWEGERLWSFNGRYAASELVPLPSASVQH